MKGTPMPSKKRPKVTNVPSDEDDLMPSHEFYKQLVEVVREAAATNGGSFEPVMEQINEFSPTLIVEAVKTLEKMLKTLHGTVAHYGSIMLGAMLFQRITALEIKQALARLDGVDVALPDRVEEMMDKLAAIYFEDFVRFRTKLPQNAVIMDGPSTRQ
jgi:hypothetical protein